MNRDVLFQKPPAEHLHRCRLAALVPEGGRILTALGLRDKRHGTPPCGLRRHRPMAAQGHAAQPPVGAKLDDVILAPRGADAKAETGELTVRFAGGDLVQGFGELDALVPTYAATIHER